MPSKLRLARIGDRMRQELSEMLVMGDLQDPRLAGVTITDVKVDRELAFASIYVSSYEGSEEAKAILAGFESASGYIRRSLAAKIQLRSFPRLRFYWDPTPERADRIEKILYDIRSENEDHDSSTEEPNTDEE